MQLKYDIYERERGGKKLYKNNCWIQQSFRVSQQQQQQQLKEGKFLVTRTF